MGLRPTKRLEDRSALDLMAELGSQAGHQWAAESFVICENTTLTAWATLSHRRPILGTQ